MDFQFGKKEEEFRSEIREFVKENIPQNHFAHMFEDEHEDKSWEFSMSMAQKLAQKKWLTISWPEEFGGMGASFMERLVFSEEVGYWGIPGTGMGVSGTSWVGPSLMLFGTKEQQEKYIPLIAAGDPDGGWCTGYCEPDSGSGLASFQTSCVRDGDEYVINGQKVWTSAAHRARWCWFFVRTEPNTEKKHHGISLVIVDMKSEGVDVRPLKNYVGLHFFNEIFFKDVRIPVENLVGQENNGWNHLMQALSFERGVALGFTATSRRMMDELVNHANETGFIKKPLVRQKLAELAADLEAARLLAYEAVWKEHNGLSRIYEPSRDKANVDILFEKLSRFGLDIIGAFSQLDPLRKDPRWSKIGGMYEHLFHVCPGMAIAAGTTDTQRNIVGQFGLQLPRSY